MHRASWDSGIPASSARPNDGIHLLFYGPSWSNTAPISPECMLFLPLFSLCLITLLPFPSLPLTLDFYPFRTLLSWLSFFSSVSPFNTLLSVPWPFFVAHCPDALFMVNSHELLIELVWPHVLQDGMNRCAGKGPRGFQTAKYQNNMSHSCLITSTVQPC